MPILIHGSSAVGPRKRRLSSWLRWIFAAAVPLLGLLWLSGCENTFEFARYPKDLLYPVRTDPFVVVDAKLPADQPIYAASPGHIEDEIAQFIKVGGVVIDPTDAKNFPEPNDPDKPSPARRDQARSQLEASLNKVFGTPRLPRVGAESGESDEVVTQLAALKIRDAEGAPFRTLAQGSKVYRFHCVHCHGLTGDGRGPTGPWVVPHPRDYRPGLFKFISSKPEISNRKPRRDDLLRVLRNGIESTSMPSFALLDIRDPESKDRESDLEAVASYVMHLSIRGTTEIKVLRKVIKGEASTMDQDVHDAMVETVAEWANSSYLISKDPSGKVALADNGMAPDKDSYDENLSSKQRADSIRRGYLLFSDRTSAAGCIGCHEDYGRQVHFRYDLWGTLVRPMNLTTGVYRGGRRPIDLYWRIKGGIDPSGMSKTGLTDDKQIWDVVNFVHNLPYPEMLPEDVRNQVYDRPPEDAGKTERAERAEK